MSEVTALTELANFVGKSTLTSEDATQRRRTMNEIISRLQPRPVRRTVGDLLGAVLALSARTRRHGRPRTQVDIDVFAPNGKRAVRMKLGYHE
ncbi:hypothetical protein PSQ90_15775 [Devosia rhodophyticola]|uniref:Uncharacterized protein n=1 Tax=Devosia rhodophyticola TaxID=3026423 RepID=A0ABY7YXR4_9HYPH|nr:hypothetical protein [Devosia rhodophyticola]WDR05694.1 hypothetical protein PSQ90_15775 [Devosia rhodophyticola]